MRSTKRPVKEGRHSNPANSIQAIILAGTHTWDNTPFERSGPTPLLPVATTPLLDHQLRWLTQMGISNVAICANGRTSQFRQFVDRRWSPLTVAYVEDKMPRGPAGCAFDAAKRVGSHTADRFLILDASVLPRFSLSRMDAHHRETQAAITMAVTDVTTAPGSGQGLVEPAGVYLCARESFDRIGDAGYRDIKEEWIPGLYRAGRPVETVRTPVHEACRIYDDATYLAANALEVERQCCAASRRPTDRSPTEALIHPEAQVSPSATLIGPVIVASGAEIAQDAVVVGPTSIGCGAHIGAGALVARSALWSRCRIDAFAQVDASVVESGAIVPRGARLSHTWHADC